MTLEATDEITRRWLVTYPDRPCDIAHTYTSAIYFLDHGGNAVIAQTIVRHPNGHSQWLPETTGELR